MPATTARAIKASVSQILKIDQNWEDVEVRRIDVDGLISRFRNLSRLAPGSLATYESRFRSGLDSYLSYLDNPASYQPKTRRPAGRDDKPGPIPKNKAQQEGALGHRDPTPSAATTSSTKLVVYPFPVRPDVFAELKLPADLTADEASRLGAFLKAVAISDGGGASR